MWVRNEKTGTCEFVIPGSGKVEEAAPVAPEIVAPVNAAPAKPKAKRKP